MNLKLRARRLGRLSRRHALRQSLNNMAAQIVLVVTGAALAGGAQFWPDPVSGPPINKIMGFLGVGLAFVGGVWSVLKDNHTPEALEEARRALEAAREADDALKQRVLAHERDVEVQAARHDGELKALRADVVEQTREIVIQYDRLEKLLGLSAVLREAVERALAQPVGDLGENLDRMLQIARRPILGAMGVEGDERWTLTVYQHTGRVLRSVANLTADRAESDFVVREWLPGEGWAGAAFSSEHEVIFADAQSPAARRMLNVPKDKQKSDDNERYRAIAAIPVRVAGLTVPWGVVIATSDRLDMFDDDPQSLGSKSAQAVRTIAGMTALVAAARPARRARGGGNR